MNKTSQVRDSQKAKNPLLGKKNFQFQIQTIGGDYVPDTACPHRFGISASRKIIILGVE